ncbi:MAG: 2,3,4,5-tetrahydropyridine-2,6-dicarboxylate N-succinyltransferase, partial [Polyangiaceae bacterium]
IMMPGYVNIGAWVGSWTMIDTWATVGSCAQIGRDCHLSGGVGIGGVLEPPGARPVIVEDGCFVGSRAIVVEGTWVGRESVIGAGVVLTASTAIIDVTGSEPVELRGRVPARSVVIPGMRAKKFPAGEFGVPCALIIGKRSEATDRKVSLNAALRDFGVAV